jgi:hypothetical protein
MDFQETIADFSLERYDQYVVSLHITVSLHTMDQAAVVEQCGCSGVT